MDGYGGRRKVESEETEEVAEDSGDSGGGKLVLLIGLINTLAIVGLGAFMMLKPRNLVQRRQASGCGPEHDSPDSATVLMFPKKTGAWSES